MSVSEEKPYPDKWHVITHDNEHRSGKSKLAVKDSDAKYYIKDSYSYHRVSGGGYSYYFDELKVYDVNFKPAKIEESGVVLEELSSEYWDGRGIGSKSIRFDIQDKAGFTKRVEIAGGGVYSVVECIKLMQLLSNYNSWLEYNLTQKVEEQEDQIALLESENQELISFKSDVLALKGNVKELYQRLFELEIVEGVQHLLTCEKITDKDIALAFGITQKKVRAIRKSLKADT